MTAIALLTDFHGKVSTHTRPEILSRLDGIMHGFEFEDMSTSSGPLAESEILPGIRQGDPGVFDALCLAYHDPLWRFAFSILHSREIAQDVVQDVFLFLWEHRDTITIRTTLAAYLFGAVRRRALMYLRNDRTAARIAATWSPGELPGHSQHQESAIAQLDRKDRDARLQQAIELLSPVQRQMLGMRWTRRMEYVEIAEVMEMTPEAVRAHVSRAYRALRQLLLDWGIDS